MLCFDPCINIKLYSVYRCTSIYLIFKRVNCVLGEMWFSITLAVVVEVVPSDIRTSAVAVYLFVIHNIGGNMSLLVPPIQEAFENLATQSLKA